MTAEAISVHGLDPHPVSTFLDAVLDLIPEWMGRGTCSQVDPEMWFPEKGGSTREAKAVCAECPVRAACLQYAIDRDERDGVWGGLSYKQRRLLKTSRPCRSCGAPVSNTGGARYCPTCRES